MAGTAVKNPGRKGALAVVECYEEIPCNPCNTCCPHNAIKLEGGINSLPELDESLCTGCGLCIARCPGQAIFVVDDSFSTTEGLVSIPYEFLPMPKAGQKVHITDRHGQENCEGEIYRVLAPASFDCTAVVTMKVPLAYLNDARGFKA